MPKTAAHPGALWYSPESAGKPALPPTPEASKNTRPEIAAPSRVPPSQACCMPGAARLEEISQKEHTAHQRPYKGSQAIIIPHRIQKIAAGEDVMPGPVGKPEYINRQK